MQDKNIVDVLHQYTVESGVDEQFDLRALQAVGIADGNKHVLRVWFNDGRIRDWNCSKLIAEGKGRIAALADSDVFNKSATIWDGAPGFDFGYFHAKSDCLDFDPYVVWVESVDVTRQVQEQEQILGKSDIPVDDCILPSVAEEQSKYE